jgi:hypothetical protein
MASHQRTGKNTALAALRAVTKVISNMSEGDLEALASGKATLMLVPTEESPGQGELAISQQERRALDYVRLRDDLSAVESTEAGFTILREAQLTRSELERLSRSLDLPVTKQDSAGRLEEKVVEALIGSRLNSRAIRGR